MTNDILILLTKFIHDKNLHRLQIYKCALFVKKIAGFQKLSQEHIFAHAITITTNCCPERHFLKRSKQWAYLQSWYA